MDIMFNPNPKNVIYAETRGVSITETNNELPIQDCVDELAASGGGQVILPPGTFDIRSYPTLPSFVTLKGVSPAATTLRATVSMDRMIYADTSALHNRVTIEDIILNGNSLAGIGVELQRGTRHRVRRVRVQSVVGDACIMLGQSSGSFSNDSAVVDDCYLIPGATANYGVRLQNSTDSRVTNGDISGGVVSAVYTQSGGAKFYNVYSFGSPPICFLVAGSNTSIVNCRLGNPTTRGMDIQASGTQIVANEFRWDNTAATAYPILLASAVKNCTIVGNYSQRQADVQAVQATGGLDSSNVVAGNVWVYGAATKPTTGSVSQWRDPTYITDSLTVAPGASVTPANNGDVTFQLTSNTSLTFKAKGSDGTVRSGSITLA